jgi:hypothetical protein
MLTAIAGTRRSTTTRSQSRYAQVYGGVVRGVGFKGTLSNIEESIQREMLVEHRLVLDVVYFPSGSNTFPPDMTP